MTESLTAEQLKQWKDWRASLGPALDIIAAAIHRPAVDTPEGRMPYDELARKFLERGGEIERLEKALTAKPDDSAEQLRDAVRALADSFTPNDGKSSWDHVEDFRKAHGGHLPSASGAPCPACFKERTDARIAVIKLAAKYPALAKAKEAPNV